ncbi:MAG: hypothetical protein GEV13_27820 [Rhodospirillales bacterium]|nr:hypothetical protein [Rhodospirillales bacterium]
MATESAVVGTVKNIIESGLHAQTLKVERGAPLLYQVRVDNNLKVIDPSSVQSPKRGSSAFQTDLCIFERKGDNIWLPRVVFEFKTGITTHDVLTYSVKAQRHKTIYPYLRYGFVASDETNVPGRFFTHNTNLDFCLCTSGLDDDALGIEVLGLLSSELKTSRDLERIAFDSVKVRLFRSAVVLDRPIV